jgi:hypothetical protein
MSAAGHLHAVPGFEQKTTPLFSARQDLTPNFFRELENNEGYELKGPQNSYNRVFDPEKCSLRLKNGHIWQISYNNSIT